MKFYKDTDGIWYADEKNIIAGDIRFTEDSATEITLYWVGNRQPLHSGLITDLQDKNGTPYADMAAFLTACGSFFVNPLDKLETDVEGLAEEIALIGSGYLGSIRHDVATAPTPGKSGYYEFTSSGAVIWLSGQVVNVGDKAYVVFTDPTYVYSYGPSGEKEDIVKNEFAIAEALNLLYGKITALEKIISDGVLGNIQVENITTVGEILYRGALMIITGTAAPAIAPDFIGQTYIDTVAGTTYTSKGITNSGDWKQTSN